MQKVSEPDRVTSPQNRFGNAIFSVKWVWLEGVVGVVVCAVSIGKNNIEKPLKNHFPISLPRLVIPTVP
jgi:hypothetical protein